MNGSFAPRGKKAPAGRGGRGRTKFAVPFWKSAGTARERQAGRAWH